MPGNQMRDIEMRGNREPAAAHHCYIAGSADMAAADSGMAAVAAGTALADFDTAFVDSDLASVDFGTAFAVAGTAADSALCLAWPGAGHSGTGPSPRDD
jgi:hypothetical protein